MMATTVGAVGTVKTGDRARKVDRSRANGKDRRSSPAPSRGRVMLRACPAWAAGGFGIKVTVRNQFNLRKLPDAAKLTKIAKPWGPYRSVASWYLWRSLDPQYQEDGEGK
jgi:hypothetical protein